MVQEVKYILDIFIRTLNAAWEVDLLRFIMASFVVGITYGIFKQSARTLKGK
ncbi:MAG: hypothetical protein FWE90_08280 [Defluviitaleaceae bacterium]|nr:hypothetical protein [Defluviitaleaceae bacterium]